MKFRTILSAAALAGSLLAIGCEDTYDNNRGTTGTVRSTPRPTTPPPTTTTPDNTLPPSTTTPPATTPSTPPSETNPGDTNPDHTTPPPTPPGTGGDSGTGTSPGK